MDQEIQRLEAEPNFSRRQEQAIENLERAFSRCAKNDVALIGMDNSLLAYDRTRLMEDGYLTSPHEAQRVQNQGYSIETCAAYLDSGGW